MNKKGFTLIELLGVVILITLISFLVFPTILNKVKESKKTIDSATEKLLINSARLYMSDNVNEYSDEYYYTACIKIDDLIKNGYIDEDLLKEYSKSLENMALKVEHTSTFDFNIVSYENCAYKENNNVSEPKLNGLTPVVYKNNNWIVADTKTPWYSYSSKRWANAVLLYNGVNKSAGDIVNIDTEVVGMYVWIPRYRYYIPSSNSGNPEEINIVFTEKSAEKTNGNYITHPAFTFGGVELDGIWVGKFETSGGANPRILPNKLSTTSQSLKSQFDSTKSFASYGLQNVDSHLMKNSEWGAVAYLSHSMYGTNKEVRINNTTPAITGCAASNHDGVQTNICENEYNTETGVLASTTGNIYGIYDMSGGNFESVMSSYNNLVGESGFPASFFTSDNSKYYNSFTDGSNACQMGFCDGSAINETLNWYSDSTSLPAFNGNNVFLYRGGNSSLGAKAGIFSFQEYSGVASLQVTYRSVIAPL